MTGVVLALLVFVIFALAGYAVARIAESRVDKREALNRRLAAITEARPAAPTTASTLLKDLRLSEIPFLDALLSKLDIVRSLVKVIRQAGIKKRAGEILLYIPLLFCVGFVAGQVLGQGTGISALIGWAGGMVPLIIVHRMRTKRMRAFSEQLPEALDLIRASLQAGHGFLRALQVVAEEFPNPIAEELREVAEEMRLGLPQRDALYGLIQRLDDPNLPMLVVGVLITQDSGGNLAEVLDNISHTIREREKIQRDMRALTAQGRMSGRLLTALPFFVGGTIYIMSPQYFEPMLTTTMGWYLLSYALISTLIGHFVLARVVKIEV
jgi:tight adherence protein B